jgi:hypothetical protein
MMRRTLIRCGAVALCLMYACLSQVLPAHAVIKNQEKCKGSVPDGAFHCLNKSSVHFVECTNDGIYMCCYPNNEGGKDCEQIESLQTPKNPKANLGAIQGGQLQLAPTNPPPRTTPVPKAGMKGPFRSRGIEGEQPAEPAPSEQTKPSSGTTK